MYLLSPQEAPGKLQKISGLQSTIILSNVADDSAILQEFHLPEKQLNLHII